ncbi:hypothetical protein BHE74_00024219 [Ensete ventricosum]|nr:hypothetical protein GW17_00015516 [Ensete ventricosum]RWW68262.1 hypothetical protein BHE74_00024219 [Ensete ventricosum]
MPIDTARTGRYVLIRQLIGTRIVLYRAVPSIGVVFAPRYQPREGERRSGRRKTLSLTLLFSRAIRCLRAISSPRAGRRNVSPRGEKERGDADAEETKTQENAKLQAVLQEMQQQFKETKSLLVKEREAAKRAAEVVPIIKEVPVIDTALMDKLKDENDKLKVRP